MMKLLHNRIIRFLLVGGINTAVGYMLYVIIFWLMHNYFFALLLSTILGVLFNYVTYGRFAFKARQSCQGLIKFFVTYAIVFIINLGLLYIFVNEMKVHAIVAQLISLPITISINYALLNYWVFLRTR